MNYKKFIAALLVVFAFSCCAFADEEISEENIRRDKNGNIIDLTISNDFRIVYIGTFRAKQPEPESNEESAEPDNGIFSVFLVKSEKDTPLQLDIREGFDTRTNKFSWRNNKPWGYIADIDTNGNIRDILADFWVRVTFWHDLPMKYGERPLIGRIGFVINGNEITYKRIRPRPYSEWLDVEKKILAIEDDEDGSEINFETLEAKPVG